jgi:hypothetical protein
VTTSESQPARNTNTGYGDPKQASVGKGTILFGNKNLWEFRRSQTLLELLKDN